MVIHDRCKYYDVCFIIVMKVGYNCTLLVGEWNPVPGTETKDGLLPGRKLGPGNSKSGFLWGLQQIGRI